MFQQRRICALLTERAPITTERDFAVKTTDNCNWRIMGAELNRYLLKSYVSHKSNRKKNCRQATAYIGYKSQYQFLSRT